jgi:hypothetical protein
VAAAVVRFSSKSHLYAPGFGNQGVCPKGFGSPTSFSQARNRAARGPLAVPPKKSQATSDARCFPEPLRHGLWLWKVKPQ